MNRYMRVEYYRSNFSKPLSSIAVMQHFGKHTIAYLEYNVARNKINPILPGEGTPVKLRWGKGFLHRRTYHGYINHIETVADEGGKLRTRVVCVGTSRRMNEVRPNSWSGLTRTAIVRRIATRNRLRTVLHPHPEVVDWNGGKKTDFQCLQKLAEEISYQLWVEGSTVYFLDPRKVLTSPLTGNIPTFEASGSLRNLKAISGVGERSAIYGLDHRTNEPFMAMSGDRDDPVRSKGLVATTYAEAVSIADSLAAGRMNSFSAKFAVNGNVLVVPTNLFRADGRMTAEQRGTWLVTEAKHEMDEDSYTTRGWAVRRDKKGLGANYRSTMRGTVDHMPAVVRDGRFWEAQVMEHVNV